MRKLNQSSVIFGCLVALLGEGVVVAITWELVSLWQHIATIEAWIRSVMAAR